MRITINSYKNDIELHLKGEATWETRGGRRGNCRIFSVKSAKRMKFHLRNCGVDFKAMVTLTYPGVWPRDWRICQRHLYNFLARLSYKHRGIRVFWFLEFQKRGAPHYHLFIDRWVDKEWVSSAWASVCAGEIPETEREKHLVAGTRCERLRSGLAGVIEYARKYAGKWEQKEPPQDFVGTGRWWGYRGYKVKAEDSLCLKLLDKDNVYWMYGGLKDIYAYVPGAGDLIGEPLREFVRSGNMREEELKVLIEGGIVYRSRWEIREGAWRFPWFVRELVSAAQERGNVEVWRE